MTRPTAGAAAGAAREAARRPTGQFGTQQRREIDVAALDLAPSAPATVEPSPLSPRDAFGSAEPVSGSDLRAGDVVLYASGARIVYENTVLEPAVVEPGGLAGAAPRNRIVFRDVRGQRAVETSALDRVHYRATRCADHNGAWGNDEYCPTCTTSDGRARVGLPRPVQPPVVQDGR